jgi:hypothetical protein
MSRRFLFFVFVVLVLQPVNVFCLDKKVKSEKVDIVAFSYDRPLQLWALLESGKKLLSGVGKTIVIYRVSNDDFEKAYEELKSNFKGVKFVKQMVKPTNNFKELVLKETFENAKSEHVMFAVDDIIVTDFVDLEKCAKLLEQEKAYGFYLRLGKNITYDYTLNQTNVSLPAMKVVDPGVYCWNFKGAKSHWAYVHTLDMTIYKKSDIKGNFYNMNFTTPNTLDGMWAELVDYTKNGLFFEKSKIVNLPLNKVQEFTWHRSMDILTTQDLLEEFNAGFKLDINSVANVNVISPHTEFVPEFIKRT